MFGFKPLFAFAAVLPACLAQIIYYQAEQGVLEGTTIGNTVEGFIGIRLLNPHSLALANLNRFQDSATSRASMNQRTSSPSR
jgi:hypothetical protein